MNNVTYLVKHEETKGRLKNFHGKLAQVDILIFLMIEVKISTGNFGARVGEVIRPTIPRVVFSINEQQSPNSYTSFLPHMHYH